MTIAAALGFVTSDPEDGFRNGFEPIDTLPGGVPLNATVIPPGNVRHPLAHSELVTLMTFPLPKNAASAPATLRTEPLATRISGPLRVLSRLPLLSENRSPDAWSRELPLRLRMAPFIEVSALALRATTGAAVVIFTFFENRMASFAKVRLLPSEALKIGAVAWNSIVSNTAPASLVMVAPDVPSNVRPVVIGCTVASVISIPAAAS